MFGNRTLLILVLFVVGSVGPVTGQMVPTSPGALPSGVHNGRYIGFKPKHGRVHQPNRRLRRPKRGVVQASAARPATHLAQTAGQTGHTPAVSTAAVTTAAVPASQPSAVVPAQGEIIYEGTPVYEGGTVYEGAVSYAPSEPSVSTWGRVEYLLWWTKGMDTPVMATAGPDGADQAGAGVLPGADILFGGNEVNGDSRSGGRYTLGAWIDPEQTQGVEVSYMRISEETESFSATNDDFGILARPFVNTASGREDSRLIAFDGLVEGALDIDVTTEFETLEALLRRPSPVPSTEGDFFIGYRYAHLEDLVNVAESTVSLDGPTQGSSFLLNDRWDTDNEFHGVQLGARMVTGDNPIWSMEMVGKVAFGNTTSSSSISGGTVVTDATGASTTQAAGLLTQGTNIGTSETNEFSSIIEIGATLRGHIDENFALSFGYTFFLWTDVVRAGDQVDRTLNPTQVPPGVLAGEVRPAFPAETTDFWAQGLRFGLDYRY